MYKCKVLCDLYYHMPPCHDFSSRMSFYNVNHSINRIVYRINDIELWFRSNFELGEVCLIERVSRNAKYNFEIVG